eukprot:270311-Pleurochrysis_carterae.AAC.1
MASALAFLRYASVSARTSAAVQPLAMIGFTGGFSSRDEVAAQAATSDVSGLVGRSLGLGSGVHVRCSLAGRPMAGSRSVVDIEAKRRFHHDLAASRAVSDECEKYG